MRSALLFLLLAFGSLTYAYSPLDYLPEGSRVSLSYHSPQNKSIEINTHQLFPPASTLKIVTALAAKLELGDDYQFETRIEQQTNNLIFRFSGDPTLSTADIASLVKQLNKKGIKEVQGDIILDNGAFAGYERAVGWPWDILGVCYSAPASAITLDENCVQASLYTNEDGTTRVHVPEHQPITVSTKATTVSKEEKKERQCELELMTSDHNQYELSGCLTNRSKPLPLKFAIQETDQYAAHIIRRELKNQHIAFHGNIYTGSTKPGALLAVHHSQPLGELLSIMLEKSDNLIADNITKTLGAKFYLQPGSFRNGTEAIKQIIYSKTGINLKLAQLADGSGLSRNNRMTAADMSKILNYIWKNESELGLMQQLPNAGEAGTLKYRRSMRKAPVKGHLKAKSGSLYGSYNMAGYVLGNDGKPKATFVQFVTDYYPQKRDDNDTVTIPAIFKFETAFYQDLIKR